MYVWLSQYPIWAKVTLGVGIAIACKILWSFGRSVRRQSGASKGKVLDVLIFNELSGFCDADDDHGENGSCTNKSCTKRNIRKIVELIERAEYSIDIAMYTFTFDVLRLALEQALLRGVQVRLISDHEMMCSSRSKIMLLNELGIEVRAPKTAAMMHHKFLVIDGPRRLAEIIDKGKPREYSSKVLTGSANWTMQGITANWELCIVSSDQVMIAKYEAEFIRMWKAYENSIHNFPKTA